MRSNMKKYALFGSDTYYPNGGALDFIGFYAAVEEAETAVEEVAQSIAAHWDDPSLPFPKHSVEEWHIAEVKTMKVVSSGTKDRNP